MKISKQLQVQESEKNVMQFFSSLADETRLHILLSIAENPKAVNEIYNFVGRDKMTLSAISHQLKQLSDQGIVISEKKGKEKFFELSDKFCWCILRDAFKQFDNDIQIRCKKCEKINHGAKKSRRDK
ncbi:MAG: metalloregulator ArsR/SmtB family transcription factor [Nanoarchaeota archaeon]